MKTELTDEEAEAAVEEMVKLKRVWFCPRGRRFMRAEGGRSAASCICDLAAQVRKEPPELKEPVECVPVYVGAMDEGRLLGG